MDDDFGGFGGGGGGDAPSTAGDDDFGGFSGGGETAPVIRYSNTRVGSFKRHDSSDSQSSQPAAPVKRTRGSTRTNMYAKSPMQRREEEAAAAEYQAMLQAEQNKQSGFGGFGGFGDEIPDDEPKQAPKQNVWGQAPNAMGIVIPPFVPREQRNARLWDAGKIKKSQSDKAVLSASHGEFLIRETMRGDRHVVCVNDQGGLFEFYIKHLPGDRFLFMSREFDDLADIVKHLQRNPLYNKQGLPLYIDKPISINK